MADKLKNQKQTPDKADNVAAIGSSACIAEGCKSKSSRMNFCPEHYEWFKFGLLTKAGKKPSDFDKKHQAFQRRPKAA